MCEVFCVVNVVEHVAKLEALLSCLEGCGEISTDLRLNARKMTRFGQVDEVAPDPSLDWTHLDWTHRWIGG